MATVERPKIRSHGRRPRAPAWSGSRVCLLVEKWNETLSTAKIQRREALRAPNHLGRASRISLLNQDYQPQGFERAKQQACKFRTGFGIAKHQTRKSLLPSPRDVRGRSSSKLECSNKDRQLGETCSFEYVR